jgi:hypothetical protein
MLSGQWKVPCSKANGKFQAWWPMEGERKILSTSSYLSPQPILLKPSIFPFDLKVLLTMVLGHYSCVSFLSLIYKLRLRISMQPILHLSLSIDFD